MWKKLTLCMCFQVGTSHSSSPSFPLSPSLIPSPTTTHLVMCRFGGVDGEVAPEHPAAEGVCGVVRFPHLPSHGHLLQETVGSLGLLFLLSRRPRPEDLRREEFTRVVQRNAKLMLRILRMKLLSTKECKRGNKGEKMKCIWTQRNT